MAAMAEPLTDLRELSFEGAEGPRFVFSQPGGGSVDGPRLVVTFVEEDVARVQVQPHGRALVGRTWTVVGRAGDAPPEGRDREDLSVFSPVVPSLSAVPGGVRLATGRAAVSVDLASAALTFSLPDGAVLLRDHQRLAYRYATPPAARGIRHTLVRDLAEVYLGLGEVSGEIDKHHRRHRLAPKDALGYDARDADPLYKHIPYYATLTPAGHAVGLLYDSGAEAVFDFGSEVDNYHGKFRYAELDARELDYYVLFGPRLADVVRRVNDLSGYPPQVPAWVLGYLGSTMRYTDAEDPTAELAGFVDKLSEHDLPCSAFHLSSGYSLADDGRRYVFEWNGRRIPDPAAMIAPLKAAGIKVLANIKPALLTTHPRYAELAAAGAFVLRSDADEPYVNRFWDGEGSYLDFTNPVAYRWWQRQVEEQLLAHGVDATWNDNNEFQITDPEARTSAGPAGDLRPVLTLLMNRASRDAQREHAAKAAAPPEPAGADRAPDAAVRAPEPQFQITRSGALGGQRYAQTWSGDNQTSWRTLQYNIAMGLGLSLSGWASYGHDVGGFAGPPPDAELLVRWIEAGVFMPRFSIHSWNDDGSATEPWTHPETLGEVRGLLRLRQSLAPYLARLFDEAAADGKPITRPYVYQYQEWRPGWRESFAYLLGDDLLVAPVYQPGAAARTLLLPPGTWLEWRSGREHDGEREVTLAAPLGQPVMLLAGTARGRELGEEIASRLAGKGDQAVETTERR